MQRGCFPGQAAADHGHIGNGRGGLVGHRLIV
jgi:hypothetical protein